MAVVDLHSFRIKIFTFDGYKVIIMSRYVVVIAVIFSGVFGYDLCLVCDASSSSSSYSKNNTHTSFNVASLTSDYCRDIFLLDLTELVESGNLSLARRKALDELGNTSRDRCKKSDIAKIYVDTFQQSYDEGGNKYLQKILKYNTSVKNDERIVLRAKQDDPNCTTETFDWNIVDPNELWDDYCSILPAEKTKTKNHPKKREISSSLSSSSWQDPFQKFSVQATHCCEFSPGSWTYLRLPVIHEPAIRLRIPQQSSNIHEYSVSLDLEQDGYLRPFDVAGILWPTGYLLSLCLGDLNGCPIPEVHALMAQYQHNFLSGNSSSHPPLALELGTGIGAGSIALAKSLQRMDFPSLSSDHHGKQQPWVVATDVAPYALALTMANANTNDVDDIINTSLMDHFNQTCMQDVKNKYFPPRRIDTIKTNSSHSIQEQIRTLGDGFAMIFGSSLQGLFQDTDRPESVLWKTLDELLDRNNPNSLAILVHNRVEPLKVPPDPNFPYRLVRRLSASHKFFGDMKTRTGETSDFEIYVFQPNNTHHKDFTSSSSVTAKNSDNDEL